MLASLLEVTIQMYHKKKFLVCSNLEDSKMTIFYSLYELSPVPRKFCASLQLSSLPQKYLCNT
jgi:hypothetical protein